MSKQGRAAEFAAFTVPPISNTLTGVERVCHASTTQGRGYCGRRSASTRTRDWKLTTCTDCAAAYQADQNHRRTHRR